MVIPWIIGLCVVFVLLFARKDSTNHEEETEDDYFNRQW